MMEHPLVSIMIPTYNQSQTIEKAIDSALAQDYPNLEIIVGDDHSSDQTLETLKKYSSYENVKVHQNEQNVGRVRNYKYLLENVVTGEWVLNLDGDDYLTDKKFISDSITLISKQTDNIVFLQGGHAVVSSAGTVLYEDLPQMEESFKVVPGTEYFLNFHHFSHLATLFKRSIAAQLDFYRYDILSSDIESFLRLAMHGHVILYRKVVGAWVQHTTNASKKLTVDAIKRNMARFNEPAAYAISLKKVPERQILKWKRHKLYSYLLHYLRIYFTAPRLIPGFLRYVCREHASPIMILLIPYAFIKSKLSK